MPQLLLKQLSYQTEPQVEIFLDSKLLNVVEENQKISVKH